MMTPHKFVETRPSPTPRAHAPYVIRACDNTSKHARVWEGLHARARHYARKQVST